MKWPQFELWRLFAATVLFATGLGLLRAAWQVREFRSELVILVAVLCFGAAFGLPFRRPLLGALIAFALLAVVIVAGTLMVSPYLR